MGIVVLDILIVILIFSRVKFKYTTPQAFSFNYYRV